MEAEHDIANALRQLLQAYDDLTVERRRRLGLNANEEMVLRLIGQGTLAPADLSRRMGMTTAGMSNMLDRLEADGLLRREPHETDKRRVLLALSKRGFRAQLELEAVHDAVAELAVQRGVHETVATFLADAARLVNAASGAQRGAD